MDSIETERLTLRKLVKEDAKMIYEGWASDRDVTKFLTWNPHKSIKVTEDILSRWIAAYEDKDIYRCGIELKDEKKLIGMIDVVKFKERIPEIGYVLSKAYWNKGYMTEALKAFVDHLISEGYKKIYVEVDENNQARKSVIKKNGFKLIDKETKTRSQSKKELVTINTYELVIK